MMATVDYLPLGIPLWNPMERFLCLESLVMSFHFCFVCTVVCRLTLFEFFPPSLMWH